MSRSLKAFIAVLALASIVGGCGSSSGSSVVGVGGGITITSVRNLDTNLLNDFGPTPTPFRITGTGFGALEGTEAIVRFWTEDALLFGVPGPSIFEGGSTYMDDVTAVITSATTIEGMTPPLSTNCDPLLAGISVDVVVEVILTSGVSRDSGTFFDFFSLPDLVADPFAFGGGFAWARACMPTPFTLTGTNFPYSGADGAALITWQATGDGGHSDLFDGQPTTAPTTDETTTEATVTSLTTIVGLTPMAALDGTANPETTNVQIVKIEFPDEDLCIDLGAVPPEVPYRGPQIDSMSVLDNWAGYAVDTFPSTILLDPVSLEPEPAPVDWRMQGIDLGPVGATVSTYWDPAAGLPDYSQFTDKVIPGDVEFVGSPIPGISGESLTIGLEPGNARLAADTTCSVDVLWPCGSAVRDYTVTFIAPPTIAGATVDNLRPPFDQTNTTADVARTWLAGVATETEINGGGFAAGVQELFFDSIHGAAFPIGGGVLTNDPSPDPGLRIATPTQIRGWSPVDNTLTARTHVTVQVLNPDSQFHRQANYWWETTGVLDNVNASQLPFTNSEMQISVNPFNHLNAAICAHDANSGFAAMFHAYTLNGGRTWTQFQVGPSTGPAPDGYLDGDFRFDPMCAFDGFGNYWCVYGVSTAIDGNTYVVAQRSVDGGQTFFDVATLSFPISPFLDRWTCATGTDLVFNVGGQALWVGLVDFTTGDLWLSGLEISAGGGPQGQGGALFFYFPVPVNDFPIIPGFDFYQHLSPSVGPNGETYMTFIQGFPPGGFLTAPPTFIWQDAWQFPFGFPGTDNLVAVTNNSATRVGIPPQQTRGKGVIPISKVIQNGPNAGRLVVVWTDAEFDSTFTLTGLKVVSQYSDDDGLTWSLPVPVHAQNPFAFRFFPWIGADRARDQVYVGYYDTSIDPVSDMAVEWYVVGSNDGINWSNPLLIAQAPSNAGPDQGFGNDMLEYNGIDILNGVLYSCWADNANFTGDNPDGTLTQEGFDVLTSIFMLDTD